MTFLNTEAERLTGWSSSEASGRPLIEVFKIVNAYTRQAVENPADKVLRLGATVGLANHTVLIARDGRKKSPLTTAVRRFVLRMARSTASCWSSATSLRNSGQRRCGVPRLRLSELIQHASIDELIRTALDEAEALTGSSDWSFPPR